MQADITPSTPPHGCGGVLAVVRDPQHRVLLIRPDEHIPLWHLPHGQAHPGESPTQTAARALQAATGLVRTFTYLLALDTGAADFPVACDGGVLTADEADSVIVPAYVRDGRAACKWVHPDHLAEYVTPNEERRIRAVLHTPRDTSTGQLTLADIRKYGKGKKIPVALRPQVRALIRQHYEAGSSLNRIAADTDRSYGWAQRTVRESGATLRRRGGNTRVRQDTASHR